MDITGTRVIVTGGASGIGEAAVRTFVREGAYVAAVDMQDAAGEAVVAAANAEGPGSATYHRCDIRSRDAIDIAFDAAVADLGGLDALVHCAGVDAIVSAETMTEAQWDAVLDVNLKGTFLTNQAAYRFLRDSGGTIVNMTSPVALVAAPDRAHYAASKGGVASLTRALAAEWGPSGINVVAISPVAHTPMVERYRATLSAGAREKFDAVARSGPLGRTGDAEADVAPVLVFLVSKGARFITGQVIGVDGGVAPLR